MNSRDDEMSAREWFDTLPDEARAQIKTFSLRSALEHVEGAIEEMEIIAEGLRMDIENSPDE